MSSELIRQLEFQKKDLSKRVFSATRQPNSPVKADAPRPPLDPILSTALRKAHALSPAGHLEALRGEVDLLRRGLHALHSEIAPRPYGVVHIVSPVKVEDKTVYLLDSGPLKTGPWQAKEKETLAKVCGTRADKLPLELDQAVVFAPEQLQVIQRLQEEQAEHLAELLARPLSPPEASPTMISGVELDLLQPGFADHLNTLFSSILKEADGLGTSVEPRQRNRILVAAQRGAHLVDQLRRLGAETLQTIESVPIHALIRHWTHQISQAAPHARFDLKLKAERDEIQANPHSVNHLLYTVLTGVADGLANQQTLIAVGSRDIFHEGLPHLHIEIRDSGGFATFAGVDPNLDRELLEEQNEVSDEFADWVGMAERTNARLRVHADDGVVTRAEIFLPLYAEEDDGGLDSDAKTIWIVEENDAEAEHLRRLLGDYGARTVRLHSGGELRDHYVSATKPPDLVVLEYYLSDTRGTILRTWLYEQDPDLPVILISGFNATHPGVATVSNLPSTLYLQKPFNGQALYDMLRMTLDETLPGV